MIGFKIRPIVYLVINHINHRNFGKKQGYKTKKLKCKTLPRVLYLYNFPKKNGLMIIYFIPKLDGTHNKNIAFCIGSYGKGNPQ